MQNLHQGVLCIALMLLTLLLSTHANYAVSGESPAKLTQQERLLPLNNTSNARELGGYTTADGRTVKRGMLFRADSLAYLDDADLNYLNSLKLSAVTDFRGDSERAEAPDRLPQQTPAINYRTLAINNPALDVAELGRKVYSGQLSEADLMKLTSREAYINDESISRMWGQWVRDLTIPGNLPHLFHCTAGKDRTGFAAAIVLLTLGVDRGQVMEDFLLSNEYLGAKIEAGIDKIQASAEVEIDPQVLRQVLGVTPKSLEGAIQAMEEKYGSVDRYIERGLGIDPATRTKLKALLLE